MKTLQRLARRLPDPTRRLGRRLIGLAAIPLGSIAGARTDGGLVALTFDDGPDPLRTPGVLEALRTHGARATFFVLVEKAESHPDLIQRILSQGHEIGLHGIRHDRLTDLPAGEVRRQIREGAERLRAVTGHRIRWFRPPYGSQDLRTYLAARRSGLDVVVWSADPSDWASDHTPDVIVRRALSKLGPGGILLLHDAFEPDPATNAPAPMFDRGAMIGGLLSTLEGAGLQSVTVGELMAAGRPVKRVWLSA